MSVHTLQSLLEFEQLNLIDRSVPLVEYNQIPNEKTSVEMHEIWWRASGLVVAEVDQAMAERFFDVFRSPAASKHLFWSPFSQARGFGRTGRY